jgi:hypothetical protein
VRCCESSLRSQLHPSVITRKYLCVFVCVCVWCVCVCGARPIYLQWHPGANILAKTGVTVCVVHALMVCVCVRACVRVCYAI